MWMSRGRRVAILACTVLSLVIPRSAPADDVVFPPASRIGLKPPAGFVVSKEFPGFEDRVRKAAMLFVELPADAYAQVEKNASGQLLQAGGAQIESNAPFSLASGPAFLVVGKQSAEGLTVRKWVLVASTPELTATVTVQVPETEADAYPEAAVLAALGTLAVRPRVPPQEQLASLPFELRDLAGFRLIRAVPGNAALLTEGDKDMVDLAEQPLVLIALAADGAAVEPGDRERFARNLFAGTPGVRDVRLTRVEPQRIGGQAGYEILAEAKETRTGTELALVQWLRFASGGHIRVVAIARKDAWAAMFPRLRAIRDGIEPR
jgi:hypothetical protein